MGIILKRLLSFFILILALGINARTTSNSIFGEIKDGTLLINSTEEIEISEALTNSNSSAFAKAAKQNNIPQRKFNDLNKVKNGYYIIAGVFGNVQNVKKAVYKFQKKGFTSNYITVPETELNYVYLEYHNKWQDAIASCTNQFNGNFTEDVWIMDVENTSELQPKSFTSNNKVLEVAKTLSIPKSNIEETVREKSFIEIAKENNIPTRTIQNLKGVNDGYYLISGVYGSENNAKKEVSRLKKNGFQSDYFPDPEENLNYTHLEYHQNWENAINSINTQFDGAYQGNVWILQIENGDPKNKLLAIDDSSNTLRNNFKGNSSPKSVKGPQNKSKLLQKADNYFDKMWYAQAAELYEQVLESEENYSYDVLQKAGDSHYFNTNMERAYHWYNILYEEYRDEMSADNIFKYAHSLKGTGKYARSKRLMRLYDRKLKNPNASNFDDLDSKVLTKEVVLDELRNTKKNFDVFNLAINSRYSEFSPMFHNDNEIVYASSNDSLIFNTRRYKWNDQPFLDLYAAKINEESQELKDAIKFSKKVNTKYHEASVTFSPDNKTMYFTRNNYGKKLKRDKKGVNHLKIYISKKIEGEWTEAVEVPFNSDNYSTGHPALSPDGKQLYFVSDMPGSLGQTDIFVVDVLEDGNYGDPRNLGPKINTERKEMFPFINNKKLYFSSDGHVGLGGLDVFEAAYDAEEGFKDVVNVGKPINSSKDDFSYIVNEETQKGFFASNRKGGKGDDDIYSFKKLDVEEVPENLNAIAGVVTELVTGDLMPKALVTLLDENNIKLKEMVAEEDGSFLFEDLDGNTKYTIKTTRGEYFDEEVSVTTKDNEVINTEIAMRRLKEMIAVEAGIRKLKTEIIYFDFDKFYIRQDASKELDKLVQVMTEYPNMVIKIESHTDSRGTKVYNKYLSDKRAKSTREYIISKGIDARRIQSAIGYGEERLINECDGTVKCTEANHFLNRRSEFIIVNM